MTRGDPAGNRLGVTEVDGSSIAWSYDDAYRLIGETRLDPDGSPTNETTFTYDPVGNRLRMTVGGVTTDYTYNELDQLLTAGGASLAYDARGNLTRTTEGADVTTYSWDALYRLSDVTLSDGTALAYGYDADGRRVRQVTDGTETNYLWDENSLYGDVVLETDAGGAALANYVLGGPELLAQTRSGSTSYYLTDALGSARSLTNSAGAVTDTYDYTAFGELFASAGSTTNPYLYTGQQFDALTGLYSLRARYYDPVAGRFLSRDPMEVQLFNPVEINRYASAANNPISLGDPTGNNVMEYAAPTSIETVVLGGLQLVIRPIFVGTFVFAAILLLLGGEIAAPDLPGTETLPEHIRARIGEIISEAEAADLARRLAELRQPRPGAPPESVGIDIVPPLPDPTRERKACDPSSFIGWWNALPLAPIGGNLPEDLYEARAARGPGTMGTSRRVPTQTQLTIDADGADPTTCGLLEAKYNRDPENPAWVAGGFGPILTSADFQLTKYLSAVYAPGSEAVALEVRTNSLLSVAYFESRLTAIGFALGIDGFSILFEP